MTATNFFRRVSRTPNSLRADILSCLQIAEVRQLGIRFEKACQVQAKSLSDLGQVAFSHLHRRGLVSR